MGPSGTPSWTEVSVSDRTSSSESDQSSSGAMAFVVTGNEIRRAKGPESEEEISFSAVDRGEK